MSEFKFACPVCGQHITADSANSGSQIECPTCFQKIVVPQAPVSDAQKFILSASKAGAPRTSKDEAVANADARRQHRRSATGWVAVLIVAVLGAGGAVYYFKWRPGFALPQRQ